MKGNIYFKASTVIACVILLGLFNGMFSEKLYWAADQHPRFNRLMLLSVALMGTLVVNWITTMTASRSILLLLSVLSLPLVVLNLVNPGHLAQTLAFTGVILAPAVLYQQFGTRVLRVILALLTVSLLASTLAALVSPDSARMAAFDGAWRGLLDHKNRLGGMAAITLVLSVIQWRPGLLSQGALLLGGFCVIMSKSSTALVCAVVALTAYFLLGRIRNAGLRRGIPLAAVVIAVASANSTTDLVASSANLLGKDVSLTGRVPLWEAIIQHGQINLFGYGLNTYWDPLASQVTAIAGVIGWIPYYSHSGYIELTIVYGLLGAAFLMTLLMFTLVRAFQSNTGLFCMLLFFVLYNISEAAIIQYDNALMPIIVVCLMMVLAPPRGAVAEVRRSNAATVTANG